MNLQENILPKLRIEEIRNKIQELDEWDSRRKKIWAKECCKTTETPDYSKPSWSTFATTNPIERNGKKLQGVRGCIAFHKIPCVSKKQSDGETCTMCALSLIDKDTNDIKPTDQIQACETAIAEITNNLQRTPPVLEILPDGSFLNEKEVPIKTQDGIFNIVSNNNEIYQVAIESRPEYISVEKIRRLLNLLRDNQTLEIYVGLESTDSFVLNEIIKKGFTVEQYEKMIQSISNDLSSEEKEKLQFSVYHFFKPPFLTEKESIEAAISMGEYTEKMSTKTGIRFSIKYEPAIISEGTLQKYLFNKGEFSTPNYLSIAEIISESYNNNFSHIIKFGQRDDIDDFQSVAAVPNIDDKHMFSPYDFIVYNAVQRFNADQDIWGFCADMSVIIKNAQEFNKWEKEIFGSKKSELRKLFNEYTSKDFDDKYSDRIKFQKRVWKILDAIEYNNIELSKELSKKGHEGADSIKAKIISLFMQNSIKVLQIKNIKFFDNGHIHNAPKLTGTHADFADATESAIYQFEVVIENEAGLPQNVWAKVPLKTVNIDLNKFDFIYNE